MSKKEQISEEDKKAIDNDIAEEIGKGPWEKNTCYIVYKCPSGKYVLGLLVDQMNCWLEDLEYIKESDIEDYVFRN